MREKDKHNGTGPEGFIKYRKGESSGADRNAFERELQKDPFAEEADEGFSSADPEAIGKDIEILRSRLEKRVKSRNIFMFYRIAASLAVLLVVTTVYFLATRKPGVMYQQTAELEKKEIASEHPAPPVQTADIDITKPEDQKENLQAGKEKQETPPTVPAIAEEILIDTAETLILPEKAVAAREAAPPVAEMRSKTMTSDKAAGAGMRKDASWSPYTPAQPVIGTEEFKKYLEENSRKTGIAELSQEVTVEVSFIVRLSGIPDSIIVVNTHPKSLSDEAVRLIKEGPRWKPATDLGKMIEERVTVKITFR